MLCMRCTHPSHYIFRSNTQDTTTILLHGSLISLQAIVHAYEGPTSRHAHAATAALLQVVRTVTERISAAYDNQVVVQVSALGNNIPLDGLRELMDWRETNTHRVLVVQQGVTGWWWKIIVLHIAVLHILCIASSASHQIRKGQHLQKSG